MSFEADLKAHLNGDASVSALILDRMYPVLRPESSALPANTYQLITLDQVENLSGRDGSLRNYRVQVDLWALKYSDILLLDSAVRARMATAATSFRSAMLPSGFDDYEPDTKLYRRMLEFSCWFTET